MNYARSGAYALGRKVDDQIAAVLNTTSQTGVTFTVTSYAAIQSSLIQMVEALDSNNITVDFVINFMLSDEVIIGRLSGRRLHRESGRTYYINPGGFPQPPEGTPDEELVLRDDDCPEAIAKCLDIYRKQTAPLIDFYRDRGILHNIDVDRTVEEIHRELMGLIAQQ